MRNRLGVAGSCPRPTYWRTFGAGAVGWTTTVAFAGTGAIIGGAIGRARTRAGVDSSPNDFFSEESAWALGGGLLGGLIGVVPGLLAQRAVLRSSACPQPSLKRLFLGNLAQALAAGALAQGAGAVHPKAGRVVGALSSFATTPISQALVRD